MKNVDGYVHSMVSRVRVLSNFSSHQRKAIRSGYRLRMLGLLK